MVMVYYPGLSQKLEDRGWLEVAPCRDSPATYRVSEPVHTDGSCPSNRPKLPTAYGLCCYREVSKYH